MNIGLSYRNQLQQYPFLVDELDRVIGGIRGSWNVEHSELDGHKDITGYSLTLNKDASMGQTGAIIAGGAVTAGGAGTFGGDVTGNYGGLLTVSRLVGPFEAKLSGFEANGSVLGPGLVLGRNTENYAWQIVANTFKGTLGSQASLEFIRAVDGATYRRAMRLGQADTPVAGEYYLVPGSSGKLYLGATSSQFSDAGRITRMWATDVDSSNGYYERSRTALIGEWTSFTPVLGAGAGANLVIGNGSLQGKYMQIGKTVWVEIHLIIGSTTTLPSSAAAAWFWNVPVSTISNTGAGNVWALQSGVAFYNGFGIIANSTSVNIYLGGASIAGAVTNGSPWGWTTSDQMVLSYWYEIP